MIRRGSKEVDVITEEEALSDVASGSQHACGHKDRLRWRDFIMIRGEEDRSRGVAHSNLELAAVAGDICTTGKVCGRVSASHVNKARAWVLKERLGRQY